MEHKQQIEWAEAQKIVVGVDLIAATNNQLEFLATIDRNRYLYDDAIMERAIYRYNAYWLPLLATHLENPVSHYPLVVPLDCEWIWHCHRLNPIRYKSDCEKLFGRVLGNHNIISSVQGTSRTKTEEIWSTLYPEEPYELDHNKYFSCVPQKSFRRETFTDYDLVSAVKRKVSFYYQVARQHVSNDRFLQEALARYKGFLHLIRITKRKNIKPYCVPTFDIDLMWHSHQLHSESYCNDLIKLLGQVLQHNDTEADRRDSFIETTYLWEETFGLNYWKAGAMPRGNAPTPVTQIPFPFTYNIGNKLDAPNDSDNLIALPKRKVVEVLLEFLEITNLPKVHKENLCVAFSKKTPDMLFNTKRTLTILSESREKKVSIFQCEPIGDFLFELCHFPSNLPSPKSSKPFGSCSLSFQECLSSGTQFSIKKWLPIVLAPEISTSEQVLLHVSLSFTPSTSTPQVFHFLQSQSIQKVFEFSKLPMISNVKYTNGQTYVIDTNGNNVLSLQMRDYSKEVMPKGAADLLKEVFHIKDNGETHTLAEFHGNEWVIKGNHGSLTLHCTSKNDEHFFELYGDKMVRLYLGRKLEFEPKGCTKERSEKDFITAIEFSAKYPYGKAIALVDFKHGILQIMDDLMVTGITLAFILFDILKKEGCFTTNVGCKYYVPNHASDSPSALENEKNMQQCLFKYEIYEGGPCAPCATECGRMFCEDNTR